MGHPSANEIVQGIDRRHDGLDRRHAPAGEVVDGPEENRHLPVEDRRVANRRHRDLAARDLRASLLMRGDPGVIGE